MGLITFLKRRFGKKKEEPASEPPMDLTGVDLSGAEPLETRYTQEYQDFLARREAEQTRAVAPAAGGEPAAEPAPEEEPETDEG